MSKPGRHHGRPGAGQAVAWRASWFLASATCRGARLCRKQLEARTPGLSPPSAFTSGRGSRRVSTMQKGTSGQWLSSRP